MWICCLAQLAAAEAKRASRSLTLCHLPQMPVASGSSGSTCPSSSAGSRCLWLHQLQQRLCGLFFLLPPFLSNALSIELYPPSFTSCKTLPCSQPGQCTLLLQRPESQTAAQLQTKPPRVFSQRRIWYHQQGYSLSDMKLLWTDQVNSISTFWPSRATSQISQLSHIHVLFLNKPSWRGLTTEHTDSLHAVLFPAFLPSHLN